MCASIAGLGLLTSQLSGCAPLPIFKADMSNGLISVPFTSFTEKNKIVIVRNSQLEFDIVLVKNSETDFSALQLKCTHQDNALTATQTGFFCSSHGSTFDLKGNVTKEPALNPLKKYKTEIKSSLVIIDAKS